MNKWVRFFLIGFIWGWVFLGWLVNNFLKQNWNFYFFKWSHWQFLWSEFQQGWNIADTSTVIFFLVALSAIPLYLIGWRFFLKVSWLKLLRRNVNRLIYFLTGGESVLHTKKQQLPIKKNSAKNTRPRPIDVGLRPSMKDSELKVPVEEPALPKNNQAASYGGGFGGGYGSAPASNYASGFGGSGYGASSYAPPSDSPFNKGFSMPSMSQGLSAAPMPGHDSFEDMLLEDIKLPERMKLEENILQLFDRAGYYVMENVVINNQPVNYLAISEQRIVIGVVDSQSGDWLADEERFNGEDPLWFSESSHRVSPVFQLVELTKGFVQRLSAAGFSGSVKPMFIERSGTIINAEDMFSTWNELSVTVCRTDIGGPDELKTVAQSIEVADKPSATVMDQVQRAMQGGF